MSPKTSRLAGFSLVSLACLFASASNVLALDCSRARTEIENMICSVPKLRAADAALSAAYFALLKATTDKEFHKALIMSQRRWLKVREDQLFNRTWISVPPPTMDEKHERVADAIDDRINAILPPKSRSPLIPNQPRLIVNLEHEKAIYSKYTGGHFSGFDTQCGFVPSGPSMSYFCSGAMTVQNNQRLWRYNVTWASTHIPESYVIANVADGTAIPLAYCASGYSFFLTCEDFQSDNDNEIHWYEPPNNGNVKSELEFRQTTRKNPLLKYDPDFSVSSVNEETSSALTDPTYPKLIRPLAHQ